MKAPFININKVITLQEAAELVKPNDTLALGGMTLYRRPVAFVRALLRRPDPPDGLTLLCFTAGYELDLLVGAGCVRRVRTCYFGLEIFGLAPMFTKAFENMAKDLTTDPILQVIEESETSLALGLRAHMNGVSFAPSTAWIGTDMLRLRPDVQTLRDPFSGEELVAFPAIGCDVAVIHALAADRSGNVRLNTNLGVDRELAMVAKTVIVTAEEIVDQLDADVTISGAVVSAVVHAPRGAWPTSCYPLYPVGGGELLRYIDVCNADQFDSYLAQAQAENTL